MAVSALVIIIFVFLAGLSIGAVITAIALSARRTTTVESPYAQGLNRDSANPYEPSAIETRVVTRRVGCGLASIMLVIFGGLIMLLLMSVIFFRASAVSAPIPMPPPTVPQPPTTPPPTTPAANPTLE